MNPSFSSLSDFTYLPYNANSGSVRNRSEAPKRAINAGAGKPIGIFSDLRSSFMNTALETGLGELAT